MKTILSKLIILVFLTPALFFASNDLSGKHTREKKIKKEFNVGANSTLNIDNSYGTVDITTWKENRVVIEVIVKTNGNDEDEVEDKLREIDVEFNQNSNGVSAKTHFSNSKKSWWKNIFDGFDNVNMEVNYIVKAPIGNQLDISNDYGGIYIDKTTGNARINCDYGKIDIGELRGNSNYLNFDYTRNSRIGYVTNAEIRADYSGFEVEEAESLAINADYTDSRVNKVTRLQFSCDYGSLNVDKVKELKGSGDYLTVKVNRVFTSLDLSMDYGSLSIDKLIKGVRQVDIKTDYAGIKLGYDPEMSFRFDVKTSYGDVNGLDGLQVQKRNQQNTSNEVSGYYGSGNDGANINIVTSYGSVKFSKQ